MRAHFVVVLPPRFDDHLRLGARTKPFEAQALVAELAVEAFRDAMSSHSCGPGAASSRAFRTRTMSSRQSHSNLPTKAVAAKKEIFHNKADKAESPQGNNTATGTGLGAGYRGPSAERYRHMH
jgi:hypothetical protein